MTTEPTGAPATSITGNSDRLPRLDVDDELVLVVPIICTSAGKRRSGAGVAWGQTIRVEDAFVLDPERGRTVVDQLRTARSLAEDAARGAAVLPGFGNGEVNPELDGYQLDESGIVAGPLAEADKAAKAALENLGDASAQAAADASDPIPDADPADLLAAVRAVHVAGDDDERGEAVERLSALYNATDVAGVDEDDDEARALITEVALAIIEHAAPVATFASTPPSRLYKDAPATEALKIITANVGLRHPADQLTFLAHVRAYELATKARSSVLTNVAGRLEQLGVTTEDVDELAERLTEAPGDDEADPS